MLMVARNSRQEAVKAIASTQPVKSAIDPTKTSISERVGFHQPAYLSAVFKKETGDAPGAWRRKTRS